MVYAAGPRLLSSGTSLGCRVEEVLRPLGEGCYSSLSSRVMSAVTASRGEVPSSMMRQTALVMGADVPKRWASRRAAWAVFTPSATMPREETMSSSDSPCPRRRPTCLLRERPPVQVRVRSPRPESPMNVSGAAPMAVPMRASSARPRVMRAARALEPKPSPSQTPPRR